jgi:hypothetical protein
MSKPHKLNLSTFHSKTKFLIANHPGVTAVLLEGTSETVMQFSCGAHAALHWAETHGVPFLYLPPDNGNRN